MRTEIARISLCDWWVVRVGSNESVLRVARRAMPVSVKFVNCGPGAKNRLDHATLSSSERVWEAITAAARGAGRFPQNELWKALDANLPEKSSAVKVAVQAQCATLLDHPALREWKRLARVAARGAHALFRAATAGWEEGEHYEPFTLVGKRSEVVVTDDAREEWEAGLAAHAQLLAREDFGALTAEQMGGLFLLTHTPDNWVKVVSSFGFDYWWLRILHLSIERNADLRIGDFALVKPNARDHSLAAMEMAQKQIATIVALKVAIFYKLRQPDAPVPRVTRHDLEQAKRKWLKRPRTRKRRRCEGVADVVSTAMNASSLKALRPTHEVLAEASAQRGLLSKRIARLDRLVCTSRAWHRAIDEQHAQLQQRVMERIDGYRSAGMDATGLEDACTFDVLQKKAISAAKASLTTLGLALAPEDSVWRSEGEAVRKLVAVGAAGGVLTTTVYVRSPEEFKRLFGSGSSGECGQRSVARAATAELEVLTGRLLALVALDFRLRSSSAAACPLPLELRPDLAIADDAPRSKPPAHVELYHRAVRQQLVAQRHLRVFEEAISRGVCHAVRSAFFSCLRLVAVDGGTVATTTVAAADEHTARQRAARNVVNFMLTVAACFDGLVSSDAPEEEEVALIVYDTATHALSMPCLEAAVARVWPAVRLLADMASECEPWVRNPRKRVGAQSAADAADATIAWWVSCGPAGLAVAPEHKPAALAAVQSTTSDWWEAWPPSREQVTTPETTATAIKWGGRATAAFLGIPKPCQFMGTPPCYGHGAAWE